MHSGDERAARDQIWKEKCLFFFQLVQMDMIVCNTFLLVFLNVAVLRLVILALMEIWECQEHFHIVVGKRATVFHSGALVANKS